MCGPLVGGAMVLYMTAFLSNTHSSWGRLHIATEFRDKSHRIHLYNIMYSCVELQIRHMSKFGVELSLFSK